MKIFSYELLTSIIEAIVHIIDIPGGAMNDHSHREMRTGEAKTEAAGLPGHGGQSLEARSCCPAPWSRCLRFSCGQPGANGSQRATRKGQARSRQSLLSHLLRTNAWYRSTVAAIASTVSYPHASNRYTTSDGSPAFTALRLRLR